MFTTWYETDPDCAQYMRHDGSIYEMIQAVWLDTTEDDIANGYHEYCIVRMEINLDDYSDEEKECYIGDYGYTLSDLYFSYDDAKTVSEIVAECILESEILNGAYVIADADSFTEAKKTIKNIIGND